MTSLGEAYRLLRHRSSFIALKYGYPEVISF